MLATRNNELPSKKHKEGGPAARAASSEPRQLNTLWQHLATRVQTKLSVSAADDPYEHEADHVADEVMRAPSPAVQRSCAACAQGGTPCSRCEEEEKERQAVIQRKAQDAGNAVTTASGHPLDGLGPGLRLDQPTRVFMEPRFGRSFGDVRVHANSQAASAAAAFSARAFTLGNDIVFAAGQYVPNTELGRRLLAHELTHVIQQSDTVGAKLQREPTSDDQAEEEHRKTQQRVNRAIGQTIWDRTRRGEPSNLVWPEHKPKDPARLLANSEEWFRSGMATLTVLTLAPDQSGASDPRKEEIVFDPSVAYPATGGSAKNTIKWEKGVDAVTKGNQVLLKVTPEMDDEKIGRRIIHEVQHMADAHELAAIDSKAFLPGLTGSQSDQEVHSLMYASLWGRYETEFRAHWLESLPRPPCPGMGCSQPDDVDRRGSPIGGGRELTITSTNPSFKTDNPGCATEAKVQLNNEKQFNIARFLIGNYFGMENAFLCSEVFRQRLKDLDHGESVNFVNSVRIERLRRAINKDPHLTWEGMRPRGEADVVFAVKQLNQVDLLFLKDPQASRPFWDAAQKLLRPALFTWMSDFIKSDKKDAPPPAPPAD